ncbi:multidrug transporter [Sporocytophaga myxococcoides]|uniref:Multidrug-efflux transporter n=1 Tax=Sporocytophaga myxococcoides TaxID=153721 RepID=A0A098LBS8_9BACT|nr:MATE family efflux transporter [Sporocytophaga myxococcoides]GAL83872.1 multidrug transporter [Sporocytophaga myxococcoides]
MIFSSWFRDNLKEYKETLRIAYPVVLSQFGHISVGVADSIMVGGLGSIPLASATFAFSVFVPFMMFAIGLTYGISPLVAKADGEQNHLEIRKILKHSIVLNVIAAIVLSGGLLFAAPLLQYFQQPQEVLALAIPFFKILVWSLVPLILFQIWKQFAEGLAITRQAMYITVIANVLNLLLNYLLIYGHYGFPKLGTSGAAVATLIARIFMAISIFIFVIKYSRTNIFIKGMQKISYSFREFKRLFRVSIAVGSQLAFETGAFGMAAIMIGWLGASEMAAHHIALNMAAVSYMGATGIGAAATVRVGNELGRKDYAAVRNAGKAAFHLVVLYMSFCALVFILFRHDLPWFYINEESICKMAASLLLISAFFQLSDGIQVVYLGALRGLEDVKMPTAIALLAYWVIALPLGYVFAFVLKMGVEGVWYGLLIGLTIAALLLYYRFEKKSKELGWS